MATHPVRCVALDDSSNVWCSCGMDIVVLQVDFEKEHVKIIGNIDLRDMSRTKLIGEISHLQFSGDAMWAALSSSSNLYMFDVRKRCLAGRLDLVSVPNSRPLVMPHNLPVKTKLLELESILAARRQKIQASGSSASDIICVSCLCAIANGLWVGRSDGSIIILDTLKQHNVNRSYSYDAVALLLPPADSVQFGCPVIRLATINDTVMAAHSLTMKPSTPASIKVSSVDFNLPVNCWSALSPADLNLFSGQVEAVLKLSASCETHSAHTEDH